VPCRIPEAEDIGGTTPGGEAKGINYAIAAKDAYCSRKYEKVPRAYRSSATGHCHPEQSDGGDKETPNGVGQSLHPI
jgi:hypothetical protein